MDEYSVTESECDPESSSGSDWSVDEGNKSQLLKKRKMKTRSCNARMQTRTTLVEKREARSKSCENPSQSVEEQMEIDSQLPVTCGNKEGSLDLEKFSKCEKCIFSKGRWFKPTEFEKFGGKEKNKKWKYSILCCGVPLLELIEDKLLLSPTLKKSRIHHDKQSSSAVCSPFTGRLRGMKRNSPKSSRATGRARKTKPRKKQFLSRSENGRRENGHRVDNDNNHDEDEINTTVFQGPTLPVTCGSVSGILHRSRFATGFCGKCIRTEDFWLTPEEFSRLSKQDGAWKKDIVTHGRPLGKLIMENVLEQHALNCECDVCLKLDDDTNDDECYMCDSEEELLCCDECPRAFHRHCHLPAVDEDSEGQWCCTFCRMKKMSGSNQTTPPDVLNSPLSQYRLHCQYLLLHLLHEVSVNKDMCETHDVKQNLQNETYQTVGEFVIDIEHIFQHCSSEGDDDLSRMQRLFKREFESIFMPL